MSVLLSTEPCPAIQRISLRTNNEQMWVYLCNLAPNLNYIHIDHYETCDVQYMHRAVTASVTKLKYLTRLHIGFEEYDTDFMALRWLIDSCHSTLQDFQLTLLGGITLSLSISEKAFVLHSNRLESRDWYRRAVVPVSKWMVARWVSPASSCSP